MLTSRKQGRGQVLIMRAGRSKAKAGNDTQGSHAQQQMKAFVPPNVRLPCQSAQATSFGIAGHSGSTIKHLIEALLGTQAFNQVQAKGGGRVAMLPQEPLKLRTIRQLRKSRSQMLLGIAVKSSFAGKLHPLPKYGQRDDFAALQ